jgi:hypothetical protein
LKNSRRYVSILAVLFAISISLAFISGCSQNVVAPIQDNPDQPALGGGGQEPVTDITVSGLIGPNGGLLQAKLDGSLPTVFRFPKGALKVETLITIRVYHQPMGADTLEAYDCGPDGTVFDVPVEVTKPMPSGVNSASLFYFNETSMQWEWQESSHVNHGVVKFNLYHFSKYGIEASLIPTDFGVDDGGSSQ